jgi:hypothetical protein
VTTAKAEPRVGVAGLAFGRWFRQVDPLLVVLVVAAAAYFAYLNTVETSRPGMAFPKGWFGYFDQSQYLRLAHDLSHFSLPTSPFLYGLGYPLAGVPFVWLGLDYDPWMIFDGLAFVFAATASFVVAGRLFGRVAAGIAAWGWPLPLRSSSTA